MFSNLEAELKRKRITREKLANELKMSISTISTKLTGKSEFTLKEAMEIKKLLSVDLPIDDLFEREGNLV